jgi:TolB-like protein/class 3 adenylate cyclase
MERRLAAILAADVVGYSAHIERDEKGTFARLKVYRTDVFEPLIRKLRGRVFKRMGDGLLAEFASVVDAVECAAAIQGEIVRRNYGLPKADRIDIRIGVNLGDVIVEGKDLHGEGVNIASRLEQLADPGNVYISQSAYEQAKNKFAFEPLGKRKLKNIRDPIRVFRVNFDAIPPSTRVPVENRLRTKHALTAFVLLLLVASTTLVWFRFWGAPSSSVVGVRPAEPSSTAALPVVKSSLAVLPFDNISGNADHNYLADGITEDLTTDLARVPGLFVVSRNAASAYKGKKIDSKQIAMELRVQYVLEGSVRRLGDQLRINAQLIDTDTGLHKWAERFDGEWGDVFLLQDKVIQSIVKALEVRLLPGQTAQAPGGTKSPAAYDAYLQGLELYLRDTPNDLAKAVPYLEKAVTLDPEYSLAYAILASLYWRTIGQWTDALNVTGWEAMNKIHTYLTKAMKHPSPQAYRVAADILQAKQQYAEAIDLLQRAIPLDPGNASIFGKMAEVLIRAGRIVDGQSYLEAAIRMDPTWAYGLLGEAQFCRGEFETAAANLEKDIVTNPDDPYPLIVLIAAYGHLGRNSASLVSKLNTMATRAGADEASQLWAKAYFPYRRRVDAQRLSDGLRKAGVPELPLRYQSSPSIRLTDEEIRSRLFGHTAQGREIASESLCYVNWTPEGDETQSCGTETITAKFLHLEDGGICYWWPGKGRECQVFLRNPNGTFEQQNEFFIVSPWWRFQFSIVR